MDCNLPRNVVVLWLCFSNEVRSVKINYGSSDLFSRIMRQYIARVLSNILFLAVQNYRGTTIPEE